MPVSEEEVSAVSACWADLLSKPGHTSPQITGEMIKLDLLEDADNEAMLDILIGNCMDDYLTKTIIGHGVGVPVPEFTVFCHYPDDDQSEMAQHAARIARASITDQTRDKHVRIIKAFLTFHLKCTAGWDPKVITRQTPYYIWLFIMHKCGPKSDGYEGQKDSTTISTHAALTLWFRTLCPQERVDEWVIDEATGQCLGLPTHAHIISEFMLGLNMMKAKSGEVSHSAHALMLDDIYQLYHHCVGRDMPEAERCQGIVRYVRVVLWP
ncbi:hypothetical protein PAXRUDRAFT_179838 [Paxillus rubicundulus Ve08.2h10]|uniref:Uncharacterized protein n=1 Tax=Paxillus rubicundulus Ve08.2h10 TaxID=930991 RepID=A0A0D0CPU0_9AGAM|nr:hypothetical protein PAXRUDRAFT_179838 [Paxillus rubicundulus Ve08.2h10]